MSMIGSSAILAASSAAFSFSSTSAGTDSDHGISESRQAGSRVLGVGHLLEQPLHVLARVQAVRLGRDHDRVHAGRRLGAARRVAEQEVLAADDERFDVALGEVVVEW